MRYILRSKEELKKRVIELCVKGKMTVRSAAQRLDLSERQIKNLKARYKKLGAICMLHGNCGRQPKNALTPEVKQRILEIKKDPLYATINFSHFKDELENEYGIKISYSTLRCLLINNEIASPKERRPGKVRHLRRQRKERFGEMLQTDASSYDWFSTGKSYALHALIDDATGSLTGLCMKENECAEGYLVILKQTITQYGSPQSLYADGLRLFFSTAKPSLEDELLGRTKPQTQFSSILSQLGIHLIHARSPQAKGRVERLWETLQSRLPVEFAKRGIKDTQAANAFLEEEYMSLFNGRFGVSPAQERPAFMDRPKGLRLDELLSLKFSRILDGSGCFSFDGVILQVSGKGIMPHSKVDVLINERLGVKVMCDGKLYTPLPLLDKKKNQVAGSGVKAIFDEFIRANCLKNEHTA